MELQVGQIYKASYRGIIIEFKVLKKNKRSYTVVDENIKATLHTKGDIFYFIEGFNGIETEIKILTEKEAEKLSLEIEIAKLKVVIERCDNNIESVKDRITATTKQLEKYNEKLKAYTQYKASAEKEKMELEEKLEIEK